MKKFRNNKGSALITVYIFLSVLLTLGAGIAVTTAHELSQTRRHANSKRAFWLAEAGVEKVMSQLKSGTTWEEYPFTLEEDFLNDDEHYSVTISKDEDSDIYTLTATGRIEGGEGTIERAIRQTVEVTSVQWPSAFDYALFGNGGSMQVKENGTVTGDIFQYGNIQIKENSTVTGGYVYATGSVSDKPTSSYEMGELPDPMPIMPVLDTSVYFDKELATATAEGGGSLTTSWIDLTTGDKYINGTVQLNADGVITGSGVIVATGDVSIHAGSTVSEGVTIISGGTLQVQESTEIGSEFLLYGATGVQIKENGTGRPSGIVITPGNVQIKEYGNYTGIIYAGGAVQIKENSTITGSVVAGASEQEGIQVKEGAYITYDQSLLPANIPQGLGSTTSSSIEVTVLSWEELAASES